MLRNKLSKEECLKRLHSETFKRITLSFYRYVKIKDPAVFRNELYKKLDLLNVFGRIYVATEGINAQLSVPEHNFEAFQACINCIPELNGVFLNIALEHHESFYKLAITIKKQIVADGLEEDSYDLSRVGTHLSPEEFHNALEDKNAIAVDFRNFYESRIGKFENAICPDSDTFKEELRMVADALEDKKDKKLLLYCTGGIRCEKASAYLRSKGFQDVNQLQGGIITYAQTIKSKGIKSKFIGKNYVFDERIAERITDDVLTHCDQCNAECDSYVNCANKACNLLFIQCSDCTNKMQNTCTQECLQIVNLSPEDQKAYRKSLHIKTDASTQACETFNTNSLYKSRVRPNHKIQKTQA